MDTSARDIFGTRQIRFYDWDDKLIGVLVLSKGIEDARPFVNFFTAVNFIHPDLQLFPTQGGGLARRADIEAAGGTPDRWREERNRKRAEAKARWPRRTLYVEESWTIQWVSGGLEIVHGLRYYPLGYIPRKAGTKTDSLPSSHRPKKKGS